MHHRISFQEIGPRKYKKFVEEYTDTPMKKRKASLFNFFDMVTCDLDYVYTQDRQAETFK